MSLVYVLIPLLPLLASILIALAGWRLGEASGKVGVLSIGISFALSVVAFVQVILRSEPIVIPLYELLRSGNLVVEVGLYIDQLAVLLLLLVTGVSFVVHVYSSRLHDWRRKVQPVLRRDGPLHFRHGDAGHE